MPRVTENSGDVRTGKFQLDRMPKDKGPVRKIRTGDRVGMSSVSEGRNPRRRASFLRHHRPRFRPDCRRHLRLSWGSARNRSAREPNSSGSVRSRSGTVPNSCDSARNKIAVASTIVSVADCKSAAAQSRDCRRTACCRSSAAVPRMSGRCCPSRDCHRSACCRNPAAAARMSDRCSKVLGGRCCSSASKTVRPGR
jgi:hypothetical protein